MASSSPARPPGTKRDPDEKAEEDSSASGSSDWIWDPKLFNRDYDWRKNMAKWFNDYKIPHAGIDVLSLIFKGWAKIDEADAYKVNEWISGLFKVRNEDVQ